jgi:hypothetical protein
MKRTWIVVLAVCTAVFFTACGNSSKNKETNLDTTTTAPASETNDTTGASQSSDSSKATQKAPGNEEEFKILSGTVISVSDNLESMTLKIEDNEIPINLKNVDLETTYALDQDVDVNIVYKGEISGSDVTNARIIMVVDAQEGVSVQEVTGSVIQQGMSSFSVKADDETEYNFLKNNCEGLSTGVLGDANNDSNGSGVKIKITYVAVGYDTHFPLKVEAVK